MSRKIDIARDLRLTFGRENAQRNANGISETHCGRLRDKWDLSQRNRNFFFPIILTWCDLSRQRIHVSLARRDGEIPLVPVARCLVNRWEQISDCVPFVTEHRHPPASQLVVHTVQLSTSGLDFAKGPFPRWESDRVLPKYSNNTVKAFSFVRIYNATSRPLRDESDLIEICGRITTNGHFRILQNHGCFRVCNARNSIRHSMRMITFISGIERWFPEDARAKILSVVATCNVIT